jgi:tRNA (adenine22-N1)-methyltransferase
LNEYQLSKRLAHVGSFVPENARLADIGSDHAYLPAALVLQGKISFAVAGEVVEGPYNSAKKQVEKNHLSDKIIVRLANGLDAVHLDDEISAVTIAGMGGALISEILESGFQKGKLSGKERLILQPNVGEVAVRKWLVIHGYKIIAEDILEENKKLYEIIVAEKSNESFSLSNREIQFGSFLSKEKSETFIKKWQQELKQREYVLTSLKKSAENQSEKIAEVEKEIEEIKEVLSNHVG